MKKCGGLKAESGRKLVTISLPENVHHAIVIKQAIERRSTIAGQITAMLTELVQRKETRDV